MIRRQPCPLCRRQSAPHAAQRWCGMVCVSMLVKLVLFRYCCPVPFTFVCVHGSCFQCFSCCFVTVFSSRAFYVCVCARFLFSETSLTPARFSVSMVSRCGSGVIRRQIPGQVIVSGSGLPSCVSPAFESCTVGSFEVTSVGTAPPLASSAADRPGNCHWNLSYIYGCVQFSSFPLRSLGDARNQGGVASCKSPACFRRPLHGGCLLVGLEYPRGQCDFLGRPDSGSGQRAGFGSTELHTTAG